MAKNWAICIGIDRYYYLQDLEYAQRDAECMRDYFLEEVSFEEVYLFSDNSPPLVVAEKSFDSKPTYGILRNFLRRRFKDKFMGAGDNFWFFFSGHGLRHKEKDYLMLRDSDPDPEGVEDTAISLSYVNQRLRRCGADNVILIFDACRNEGARQGLGVGEEKQKGVITIASCSPSEKSYEIKDLKQGSFTYALLEALRIQGEGNCATVERLDRRLRYRVSEINLQYKKPRQTPYIIPEPASKIHLILLPEQATLADIQELKNDAYRAEVRQNWELAKQLWIRVNIAARGTDQDAIEAIQRFPSWKASPTAPSSPETLQTTTPSQPKSVIATSAEQERIVTPSLPVFDFDVVTVNASGKEVKRDKSKARYFKEDLGNGVTLDLVAIPGGKFLMGTEDEEIERLVKKFDWDWYRLEKPQHSVTVKAFFMGKFPVTQAQWRAVANLPKVDRDLESDPSNFKGNNRPVEQVSWYDAVEFCKRLSKATEREYRLPSEAEWEYACRAGTTTPFHFGETITSELANYDGTITYADEPEGQNQKQTTDVGKFPPNAFGLYDMHGNVFEWCADAWHDNYEGAPNDGSAWTEGGESDTGVLRGGSWGVYPSFCRSAYRVYDLIAGRVFISDDVGFRVVCVGGRTQ
ncbi:MAG: SUMF1/EgtB/PvdO family nonheme iron enzyme [Prochloraceae cyanobacterium]|nr:SUMF1/EgtB/PvdO family nonheme iron enzyme [Prochloraceae cyanobacterium]